MDRAQNENQNVVPCGPKLGHVKLDGLILGKCSLSRCVTLNHLLVVIPTHVCSCLVSGMLEGK
jgi:hypothetical protein